MNKSEKYGLIGSATLTVLLLLLLFFIVMPGLKTPEDEGVMISFGETLDGGGVTQKPTPKVTEPTPQKPSEPKTVTAPKPTKNDYVTQKDNSVALNEQKKKEKEERDALEKQRLEEARVASEKRRREQEAIDNANTMDGLFGSGGSKGSGNTSGNATQGNPVGLGNSGGHSWSLTGRSLSGRLVEPSYENDVEGKITVSIVVDTNGNVTRASIGTPTNISDPTTRNAALAAARSTKFTAGSGSASGSITYNFKLR
ncbi:MAG: TonB family protein [Paludibacter sp.]|nr:TonB family protein [Paludibacter sp.]